MRVLKPFRKQKKTYEYTQQENQKSRALLYLCFKIPQHFLLLKRKKLFDAGKFC